MMGLTGCHLTVYTESLLGVELQRRVEPHHGVSLTTCLCFRNSLCSSLLSLYFLPPRDHQELNGHKNEATFLLCIMMFTRNRGRRNAWMKLITLASSLPFLTSLYPPSSLELLQTFYLVMFNYRQH